MDNITKTWPKAATAVLDGVSVEVGAGEAIWIGGRNGVGKTTLLRVATGLIAPDTGSVRLDDLDVERDRESFQRRTAFLPTGSSNLYARLTVRQHLRFWGRLAMLPRERAAAAAERLIGALDLRELADRRVDRMSMGQRQRIRLASVFLHEPDIAMLDEPANSLDEEGAELLVAEVRRVLERGGGVIWCSPKGDVTSFHFTRRFLLTDGRLEAAPTS